MTQEALFQLAAPAEDVTPAATAARPAWVEEILLAALTWRRSAKAKLEPCRKCRALTLYAADMGLDLCGESRVDVRLLDRGLELEVLLTGRYTCELEVSRHGGGPLVFRRDRWLAPTEPNARRRLWVPGHACGQVVGHELPLAMIYPAEYRAAQRVTSERPPF